ncbi:YraN family protein [Polaribacter litorisediminis]|uniref:YraN family protein n=1 Tax=Polaribacter litorisediminis TaxID=1908341 RepID=UPI001CBC2324|nr:YraN family protein [Polaribacter litorisediminis]UAM97937.1 YraN family protein [Polaribacter litorisediminis]
MADHNELGKKGEKLAIDFLIKNEYKILEKNYRYLKAEVDIIAKKGAVLAVVEVKTRSTDYFGDPQDFITPKKIKLLLSAVDYYVVQRDLDVEVRFDIIAIIHQKNETKIDHLKDAFLHF